MLRKRWNGLQRLFPASPLPVGAQLVPMEESPLGHKRPGAGRQRSGDQLTIEIDRSDMACIAGMKVRASMRALVPVHPDRNPIEETDPRHAETLRAAADGTLKGR
jgi:hypothetical protein